MLSFHRFIDCFENIAVGGGSKNCIYFRDFVNDFVFVALRHTSGDNQDFTAAGFFVFCHFEDGVNTFFLGIVDKAAGIDNDRFCFCLIVYDFESVGCEKS